MVIGGVVGGLIGVLAAQLYLRSAESEPGDAGDVVQRSLEPGDVIKLTLSVLSTLKLIDGLRKSSR
jgi:hypothetical protein